MKSLLIITLNYGRITLDKNKDGKLEGQEKEEFSTPLKNYLYDLHDKYRKIVEVSSKDYKNRFYEYYRRIIDVHEQNLISFALKEWGLDNEKYYEIVINSKLTEIIRSKNKNLSECFLENPNQNTKKILNNCLLFINSIKDLLWVCCLLPHREKIYKNQLKIRLVYHLHNCIYRII